MLSKEAIPFNYADDSGLVYVITESNRNTIIDTVNADLQALLDWGADNRTTFEPKKTHIYDGGFEEGVESLRSNGDRDERSPGGSSEDDEVGWVRLRCQA